MVVKTSIKPVPFLMLESGFLPVHFGGSVGFRGVLDFSF